MKKAQSSGDWEAALLLAVHASIAASDAFTIRYVGKRCASGRHEDAAEVFESVPVRFDLASASRHLSRVLDAKDWIEYSGRDPRPEESAALCDHARKFVDFVRTHLA